MHLCDRHVSIKYIPFHRVDYDFREIFVLGSLTPMCTVAPGAFTRYTFYTALYQQVTYTLLLQSNPLLIGTLNA
jgi:hypothetical protein